MGDVHQMKSIIETWAKAEKRAKHLCAFETLGLNIRCRKPNKEEVRKAWHRLCLRFHPDKHSDDELATEATRCINLAKQHLFEVHFGDAAARVSFYHDADAKAKNKAEAEAKAKEVTAVPGAQAQPPLADEEHQASPAESPAAKRPRVSSGEAAEVRAASSTGNVQDPREQQQGQGQAQGRAAGADAGAAAWGQDHG
jgi:DnaJ-class molecular chaperone